MWNSGRQTGIGVRLRHWALPLLLLGLALVAVQPAPAHAGEGRTMLIIDQSINMTRPLAGIPRSGILANALGRSLETAHGKIELGIVSYGHRKGRGCSDAQLVKDPAPLSAPEHSLAIAGLKQGGSAAIGEALELASKSLDPAAPASTLVLVSGGLKSCEADPCAVAADLKKRYPGLKAQVIALRSEDEADDVSLRCLAKQTRGTYAIAHDEAELTAALDLAFAGGAATPGLGAGRAAGQQQTAAATAPAAATGDAGSAPATTGWATGTSTTASPGANPGLGGLSQDAADLLTGALSASAPAAIPIPAGSVPVNLDGLLFENGPQIENGLVWRIFAAAPDSDGRYPLIKTVRDARAAIPLPPGDYLVNAAYGRAYLTKKITIATGTPVSESFVLNAGGMRLAAALANGLPVPAGLLQFDIYSDERDQFGNRALVMGDAKPGLIIRLNAGIYHVISTYGDANAIVTADVSVEAGKLTDATVTHTAGRVTFKLVTRPGGEAIAGTHWKVVTPAGDLIKESYGALPSHLLAAGRYKVKADREGQQFVQDFAVGPGDVSQIELIMQ